VHHAVCSRIENMRLRSDRTRPSQVQYDGQIGSKLKGAMPHAPPTNKNVIVPALVDVHSRKRRLDLPMLKSVVIRMSAPISTNPPSSHPILTSRQLTILLIMSSFHTFDHSAYWSCGPGQLVEDAVHEQAAATFYRGANAPVTVSLDHFQDEVTHISQSQNLDSIFADVLDELLPNTGVGHGDLGTSAGASNLAFGYSYNIPDTDNYTNAVRTQRLFVNRGIPTYGIALQDFLGAWPAPAHRGLYSSLTSACVHAAEALTESYTPASTPSDATAWDRHIFRPSQSMREPQGVSASPSSTKAVLTTP
jgi:hypothetical protein